VFCRPFRELYECDFNIADADIISVLAEILREIDAFCHFVSKIPASSSRFNHRSTKNKHWKKAAKSPDKHNDSTVRMPEKVLRRREIKVLNVINEVKIDLAPPQDACLRQETTAHS
jgi:hypothetical protein